MAYLFEIQTVQSGAFRVLIEALKEILADVNMEISEAGIKVMAVDNTATILAHMKLEAANFEKYVCQRRIVLGVSMGHLFKLIKTMSNNDTLTLFMEEDNTATLGIRIENTEKNSITRFHLNLMDLNEENIRVPPTTFESVITMPSADFQKHVRDMSNLAEVLEINSVGQQLTFRCNGEFAKQETIIGETSSGMSFLKNDAPDEIVQGLFSLKHLLLFTKCTNLSNTIELFLKNDYPMICRYAVASLGSIKLCLSPKIYNE
jgi:proliferating cell nuclear antigen